MGAVWISLLLPNGEEKSRQKISALAGLFEGELDIGDGFGTALAALPFGDSSTSDGVIDLAVGASTDDDGQTVMFQDDFGAAWMLRLNAATWAPLGEPLAGSNGLPRLGGQGPLIAGTDAGLELSSARPGGAASLVVGFSLAGVPLAGGVLVPAPDILVNGLPIDASGALTIDETWPTGIPAGLEVLFQFWIVDPQGPQGYAASNGLSALTPP